jgi:hypothetical protein
MSNNKATDKFVSWSPLHKANLLRPPSNTMSETGQTAKVLSKLAEDLDKAKAESKSAEERQKLEAEKMAVDRAMGYEFSDSNNP